MRRWLRVARLGVHLAAGCALSALGYPLLPRRARLAVRRDWARGVLDILNVRVRADAPQPAPGSLLVANHISWLDPVVLNALWPTAVVAKSETRRWPLLGSMLERNDTLFVERRPCRALLALNAGIAVHLARGETVAVFPEGTTTDGSRLLAFRAALFEPAVRGGHAVVPLALAYRDRAGRRCAQAAYVDDMSLWQSLRRVARLDCVEVEVAACDPLPRPGLHRRAAARLARAVIQQRLRRAAMPAAASSDLEGSGSPGGCAASSSAPAWAMSAPVSRT
jgi:1-acyl-sn-glycerol-3-phosphate acyltransferase